jgi:hypothetical protein
MVIYQVIHNLAHNTIRKLQDGGYCDVSRYAEYFATKGEATKYVAQLKKGLRSFIDYQKEQYKADDNIDTALTEVSATKYMEGSGFGASIKKIDVKTKADLISELGGKPLQEFYDFDIDCNPFDHYDCAVFIWDADEARNNSHATRCESYEYID